MRLLIVNPNTTEAVTKRLVDAASGVASPATTISGLTAPRGFPYISNRAEAQIGGAIALEMLAERHAQVDACIIGAFGDPGLLGARTLFDIPVIGMSEASMLTACMLGRQFAIITFAEALANWYRDCVGSNGLENRCASIRGLRTRFASIAGVQEQMEEELIRLANLAVAEDGADVIILAGAPLAGLAQRAARLIQVPVVDPISAAVKQAEAIFALAPRIPAAGSFRRPDPKETMGLGDCLGARITHRDPMPVTR
jgi:allantoin racemase